MRTDTARHQPLYATVEGHWGGKPSIEELTTLQRPRNHQQNYNYQPI